MNMAYGILLFIFTTVLLLVSGCSKQTTADDVQWELANPKLTSCTLKLVAYASVSDDTIYWAVEEIQPDVFVTYTFNNFGDMRMPNVKLGYTWDTRCVFMGNVRLTEHNLHKADLFRVNHGVRFEAVFALEGYHYLIKDYK